MGSSFKIVDDFEYPTDFGFTQSAVGRHDPLNHPDTDGSEPFGKQKLAEGGKVKKKAIGGAMPGQAQGAPMPGQAQTGAMSQLDGANAMPQQAIPGDQPAMPKGQVVPGAPHAPSEVGGNPVHDAYNVGLRHGARVGAQMAATHLLSGGRGNPVQTPGGRPAVPGNPMPLPQGRAGGGSFEEEFGGAHAKMLDGMAAGGPMRGVADDNAERGMYGDERGNYKALRRQRFSSGEEDRMSRQEAREHATNPAGRLTDDETDSPAQGADPDQVARASADLDEGKARGGKFIQKAHLKKGALHEDLGIPEGEKIPAGKLEAATHSSNPTVRRRANLAETMRGLRHPGKKG